MQVTYLTCSIIVTKWVPRPRFEWAFTRELLEFSRHILFIRVMQKIRTYAGTLAVGMFLGMTEAGLFRAAERIVAALSELVAEPARILAWIVFRRVQENSDDAVTTNGRFDQAGTRFIILLIVLAAPVFLGLGLVSSSVIEILLGEKWIAASTVVSLLCIKQILLIPSFVSEPLLSISGNIRKMPPVALLNAIVAVGAMVLLAPFGLFPATIGQIVAAIIAFGTTWYLQSRYGGIRWGNILREVAIVVVPIAVLTFVTLWTGSLLSANGTGIKLQLALQTAVGAMCYFATLALAWKLGFGKNIFFNKDGEPYSSVNVRRSDAVKQV